MWPCVHNKKSAGDVRDQPYCTSLADRQKPQKAVRQYQMSDGNNRAALFFSLPDYPRLIRVFWYKRVNWNSL